MGTGGQKRTALYLGPLDRIQVGQGFESGCKSESGGDKLTAFLAPTTLPEWFQ